MTGQYMLFIEHFGGNVSTIDNAVFCKIAQLLKVFSCKKTQNSSIKKYDLKKVNHFLLFPEAIVNLAKQSTSKLALA